MVRITTSGRLVLQSSLLLLDAIDCVSLHSLLPAQPSTIDVGLSFHCNVEQLESCPLPVVIAAVYQFVDSAIESTLFLYLAFCQPVSEPFEVQLMLLPYKYSGSQTTESVASMSFTRGCTRDASLISLAACNEIPHSSRQFVVSFDQVEYIGCDKSAVKSSHVHLTICMDWH